jgi:hypothetical protein
VNGSVRFAFDARRWTRNEVITASLSLVLLALLPRPWYDVRLVTSCIMAPPPGRRCHLTNIGSVQGTAAHAYLWLTVLPFLIIIAILVLRAGLSRVSFLVWPTDRQLLAAAACTNLIIVLTAFLMKARSPVSVRGPDRFFASSSPPAISITWESGAWLALVLAAAAAATPILNMTRPVSSPAAGDEVSN